MTVLQIVILLFIIFVVARIFIKYNRRDISFREWLVWNLFWLTVGVAAVLPKTTDLLARQVGLGSGRGVDLAVYIAIPILFYIIFRLFARLDRIEKDITKLVRSQAIHQAMKEIGKHE